MVVAGISSIIALGVASIISNQNKEIKAIGEKLATKELELQLKNMLSNPDYCNCLLRNKKFNTIAGSEAIVVADQITSLKTGYSTGPLDAVPCTAIATDFVPPAGSNIPDSTMKVGSVGLTNMTLVSPATYKADLQVNFTATVRAIKPIKTSLQFTINPTGGTGPTDRPFVACSSTSSNNSTFSKGSIVCVGDVVWDHHDWGSVNCVAPQTGYYRGIDNYRGSMAISPKYFANSGDTLQIQGYWTGGSHGCYERFSINGTVVDNGWGDNGCNDSLSNYWIIFSYDQ